MSAHCGSVLDAGTVRGPPSPRKPIPSNWLPERNAPKLATAQRAKERVHKKGSVSGSPIEAKTLRGTRSLAEMGRAFGSDGATFLTKDTLTTVESDITSPPAVRSPTKHARTSSKPAWNSPVNSSPHESPRQKSTFTFRTSPTKKAPASPYVGSVGRRGPSSVATSTGETVFHSAEGSAFHSAEASPVRSTADSEQSFKSPAEVLDHDDTHIPHLQLSADNEDEQAAPNFGTLKTSSKLAANGKENSRKPQLTIDTSSSSLLVHVGGDMPASESSATSDSATSNSPWSATSASSSSRIPRVNTGSLSSKRAPTRSSTLKGAPSVKSLTSPKTKPEHADASTSRETVQPGTPVAGSVRHVRTVDSSGRTPITTRRPTNESGALLSIMSTESPTDTLPAHDTEATLALVTSSLHKLAVDREEQLASPECNSMLEQSSRASSMCTVKATPVVADPAMVDSAIIYSRKSSASGTIPHRPIHNPPIIVMMAHNLDIGSLGVNDIPYNSSFAPVNPPTNGTNGTPSSQHVRAESVHSLQSSHTSDLRATAAEFVPNFATKVDSGSKETTASPPVDPSADLLGDQKFELDMYGIPWFYYMHQVQFAYEQGFHYGRSKSPKKFRSKKQRSSVSSPADAQPSRQGFNDMPPPASTVPLAEQRAQQQRENLIEEVASLVDASTDDRSGSPFATQKDVIARQAAVPYAPNSPRMPHVDLTTIRNVPSRSVPPHLRYNNANTLPNRGQYNNNRRGYNRSDNGLYNHVGCGMFGVPMHDTVPFPHPIAPQGRPMGGYDGNATNVPEYRQAVGSEACGVVELVTAAERVGGEACNKCEPDHPME
jgi:hypothetical protein